jgi:hypothetical protein
MGIYAFIYRDKISQMLPNWQGKGKSSERMILDEGSNPIPPPIPPGMALAEEDKDVPSYKSDVEAKEYPEIPKTIEKTSKQEFTKDPNPKGVSELSSQNSGTEINKSVPNTSTYPRPSVENPAPLVSNEKPSTMYSPEKEEVKKESTLPKPETVQSVPQKITYNNKKVKYNQKKSKHKQKKSVNSLTSMDQRPKKSKPKSQPVVQNSSIGDRIERLESKLNVHMQDTNTRIEAIERRVEKLEKKFSENP